MKLDTLDARVKLLVLVCISTMAVVFRRPLFLAALLALVVLVLVFGRVSLGTALGKVRGALGLIASLFLLQCIFNRQGEPLLLISGFTLVTDTGLETAVTVCLRLLILLLTAMIMVTGQRREYIMALNQLGLPYEISFMVMAGLRFLPLLREEAQDVLTAMEMRGAKLSSGPITARLRLYLSACLPIVAGAIDRSQKMAAAMEARAFRAMPQRTSMNRLTMTRRDWCYMEAFLMVTAAMLTLYFI